MQFGITRGGEGRKLRRETTRKVTHTLQACRDFAQKELNCDSAGNAMAYVRFDQILYSANCTWGPADVRGTAKCRATSLKLFIHYTLGQNGIPGVGGSGFIEQLRNLEAGAPQKVPSVSFHPGNCKHPGLRVGVIRARTTNPCVSGMG